MKACRKCGFEKPELDFRQGKICRPCERQDNRERMRLKRSDPTFRALMNDEKKKYSNKNREKINAYEKQYRSINKDRIRAKQSEYFKKWYQKNKKNMAKTLSSFRLSDNTEETITKLAAQKGISKAELIALAVEKMKADEMPYEQKALLEVYEVIGKNAEILGNLETYADEKKTFSPEKQEVLDLFMQMWDMCRASSVFTEKQLPE